MFEAVKWSLFTIRGIITLCIGILVLIWTEIAGSVPVTPLGTLLGLTAITVTIFSFMIQDIMFAVSHPEYSQYLYLIGSAGVLVGILGVIFSLPQFGAAFLAVTYFGVFAVLFGMLNIILGFRIRTTGEVWNGGRDQV